MAVNINRATLVGNTTDKAKLKFTKNNTPYIEFTVVTNKSFKKDDEWQEVPTYHRVVAYGKIAEGISKNIDKGKPTYVEGSLRTDSWESEGRKMYRTVIVADKVIFFHRKPKQTQLSKEEKIDLGELPF